MQIRRLEKKDAKFMLEWMHDDNVVKDMQNNFKSKTIEDCERFITFSNKSSQEIHRAIVDDEDCYMGTVSLKNINKQNAEFAITVRRTAMGKGFSSYGMKEIIRKGFKELDLELIYWYVKKSNIRAIKFYEKMCYGKLNNWDIAKIYDEQKNVLDFQELNWYGIKKSEFVKVYGEKI